MADLEIHELSALSGSFLRANLLPAVQGTADAVKATGDQLFATLRWKDPVATVDTAGLSPSTAYEAGDTVGGLVLTAGDRILRATPGGHADDGIYVASASGAAARAADAPSGGTAELVAGAMVFCQNGFFADSYWRLSTTGTITVGTTAQDWAPVNPRGRITGISELWNSGYARYVSQSHIDHNLTTFNIANNRAYLSPLRWPLYGNGALSLRSEVTTAASSTTIRMAMYRGTETGAIGARLYRTSAIDTTATGIKEETFSRINLKFDELLWLGIFVTGGTLTMRAGAPRGVILPLAEVGSQMRPFHAIIELTETDSTVFPEPFTVGDWTIMTTSNFPLIQVGYAT